MFCEKCGAQIEDGSLFCEKCGTKVENEIENVGSIPPVFNGQNLQSMPNMQVPPQMQAPVAPKAPMSKGMKILLAEIAILVVVIFAFYKIGEKQFGPETIADQYFTAESKGDWNMVYEMMDLPDSAMLTKEMFLYISAESKLKDITNYTVAEVGIGAMNKDAIIRQFQCEYMASGENSMSTEEIQLVKQQDKKWLFFDNWKVSPNNNLVEDYKITIPNDATATINGIDIEELAGKPDAMQTMEKCYTLPKAFAGRYELIVKAPYRQDYVAYITIDNYNSTYVRDMIVNEDILEQVAPICDNALEQFYTNAINGKIYDGFRAALGENITSDFDATYLYENEKERLTNNSNAEYAQIDISEIEYHYGGYGFNYDTGNLYIECSAQYTCLYEGNEIWTDWWSGKITKEPMKDWSRTCYINFDLELIDGQWKIVRIN